MKSQNKTNQLLLVIVIIFGAGSLGYGAASIYQRIVSPFKGNLLASASKILNTNIGSGSESQTALRNQDTDKDTLNDFDEINLYGTSPYQQDSDSDGISDDKEVAAGTDPNCPPGEDCRRIRLVTPETRISDIFPQFSTSTISLKDKTIQEFKQILLSQGFDREKLNQIDNQTLLLVLEESLRLQDEASKGTATSTTALDSVNLDQARQFLISLGVPQDEVYGMSNKELEDLLKTFK